LGFRWDLLGILLAGRTVWTTTAEIDKVPGHLRLTAQVDMEVGGQHMREIKTFRLRLASTGTGDAIGAGRQGGVRLIDRIVKTVPMYSGAGGAKQGVLQKSRLGIAKLL
jgi:hypothetical protein